MVFITALQMTLVGIMAITGYECGRYYTDGLGEQLLYTVLPRSAYRSHVAFEALSYLQEAFTGFFVMPLLLLGYVHARNFCNNRTTNERFSGKAYSNPNQRNFSDADSQRTASMYSTTSSMQAVNLVNDLGKPVDTNRTCAWIYNIYEMCKGNNAPD